MGSPEVDTSSLSLCEASQVKEVLAHVAPNTRVAVARISFETGGLAIFNGQCWKVPWFKDDGSFDRFIEVRDEEQWRYTLLFLEWAHKFGIEKWPWDLV